MATTFTTFLVFVLTMATTGVCAVEIRGPVGEVEDGQIYSWGPQDFAGFYYDIDDDIGTETITLVIKGDTLDGDTIPCGIIYRTDAQIDDFEFDDWGCYYVVGFLGVPYFAGYVERMDSGDLSYLYEDSTNANRISDEEISKIVYNDDEDRTIAKDTALKLGEGYELLINTIDLEGDKVFVELYKNNESIDSSIVEPSRKNAEMEEKTYTYRANLGNTEDIVIIAVHFKNVFHGAGQDLVTIDGVWQISDTCTEIEEGSEFDEMTIQTVSSSPSNMFVEMDNEDEKIVLNKNKDIELIEDFRIKTADQKVISANRSLRFYIYKEITEPGTYEIRGEVAGVVDNTGIDPYVWDSSNFAGFFYDIDEDLGREKISMIISGDVLSGEADPVSGRRGVIYETESQRDRFEFEEWGEYWTIGFLGEEYFAAYVDSSDYFLNEDSVDANLMVSEGLSKVLTDDDEDYTFTTGTPLKLNEGYELAIKEIDLEGNKVYVELHKDNETVDTSVVEPSKSGATIADKTYTYKKDLGDSEDVVVIAVHFKSAFRSSSQDIATVDGIWQISDEIIEIEENTEYGKMTVQEVDSGEPMKIIMDNEDNKITLGKDKDIRLMENIKIRTADQDEVSANNPLRFYIYEEVAVEEGEE